MGKPAIKQREDGSIRLPTALRGLNQRRNKMEYYYKPCNLHFKEARYCLEEKRWICEDCEPELRGIFKEIGGIKVEWGDKEEPKVLYSQIP